MIFTIIGTCLNYLNKLKLLIQKQQHSLIPIWYNLQIAISIFFMEPLKKQNPQHKICYTREENIVDIYTSFCHITKDYLPSL